VLPAWLCRAAIWVGYVVGKAMRGRLDGSVRRIEMMWFGQAQCETWSERVGMDLPRAVSAILAGNSPQSADTNGECA
jgi:hypothetical protein